MFLGIDLGTSGVKLVLIDEEQRFIDTSFSSLTLSRPQPLWSEQDPEHWWQATERAVLKLKQQQPTAFSAIKAIGLSGQMHGATLLNKDNKVLRPAILWNDGRAMAECDILLKRAPKAHQITGNLIMPGFTAPKLLWVQQHEPHLFSQIQKILLPKDYLRWRMSGDFATDLSDASGTSWLDVGKRTWSEKMLNACDLNHDHMPLLYEGSEITGEISPNIAAQWGMDTKTKIIAGGGDNAASAISMGVTKPGFAFLSLGTSGVLFSADNQYRPNPADAMHTMCHCLPNLWHEMNVHLSSASCINWLAKLLGQENIGSLIQSSEQLKTTRAPLFLPYLSGERTPHNNPYARGVFFGLDYDTNPASLLQAVMEGVAFSVAEGLENMQKIGIELDEISVIGGGACNLYWGEILASALQKPLLYRESAEVGGALGAARLAWHAIQNTAIETAFTPPQLNTTVEPDPEMVDYFSGKIQQFKQLYRHLKDDFSKLFIQPQGA